ncbi:MAG: glycosyltransferase family 39 protein [Candidatus Eremiobacteraeota bacterium]|nr:glycosyltransferase family 39 protein [Candidatus Eremiobacteraeota bacterium]
MKLFSARQIPYALLALVVVAVLMRLPALLHDGLWRDGAYLYVDFSAPTLHEAFRRITETEWHPPLYFILAYLWTALVGISERSLTLLPFLISVATIPVVYWFGAAAGGRACGLAAAATCAVSPLAITYSAEYLYPLAVAVFALPAWAIILIRRDGPSTVRLVALAAATALTVNTHYVGLFYVPALIAWVLVSERGRKSGFLISAALVAGALTFVPWAPIFLHQQHVGLPYRPAAGMHDRASFVVSMLLLSMPARPLYLEWALAAVVAGGVVLAGSKIFRARALELGAIFVAMLLCLAAADLLQVRYAFVFEALMYVFIGWALCATAERLRIDDPRGWRRFGAPLCAAFCILFLVGDVQSAVRSTRLPKSGIRTFAAAEPPNPNTLYVAAPDYMAATLAFYFRGTPARILGFARLQDPEIFRLDGYVSLWSDPTVVDRAINAVAREGRGYRYLDVVVNNGARNIGQIPYGKTQEFLRRLEARYRILRKTIYDGRIEPVTVYHLVLE